MKRKYTADQQAATDELIATFQSTGLLTSIDRDCREYQVDELKWAATSHDTKKKVAWICRKYREIHNGNLNVLIVGNRSGKTLASVSLMGVDIAPGSRRESTQPALGRTFPQRSS